MKTPVSCDWLQQWLTSLTRQYLAIFTDLGVLFPSQLSGKNQFTQAQKKNSEEDMTDEDVDHNMQNIL